MCKMAGGGGLYVSHSYVQNIVHLVFSTKEHRKLIPAEFHGAMGLRGRGLQEERNFRSRGGWDGRSCPFVGPNSGDAGIGQGGPDDQVEFIAMDA